MTCMNGKTHNITAAASGNDCNLCLEGKYSTEGNPCASCPKGFVSADTRDACDACGPGKYSPDSKTCAACPEGKYSDTDHQTSCKRCFGE